MAMIKSVNVVMPMKGISIHTKTCVRLVVNIVNVSCLCKGMKMNNPCTNCLVVSACTQICSDKTLYGCYINARVREFRETSRNPETKIFHCEQWSFFEVKSSNHYHEIGKIIKRSEGML